MGNFSSCGSRSHNTPDAQQDLLPPARARSNAYSLAGNDNSPNLSSHLRPRTPLLEPQQPLDMGPPPPGMDPAGLLEFIDISDDEPSIIHTPHNRPAVPPQPASSPIRAIPKRMMRPLNAGPSARGRDNHMSKQSKLQNEYEALEDWNEDGDFIQQASQNVGNFTPSQGSLQRQIAKMEHVNNESNAHNFGDPADETDEQDDARREQCIDAVVECLPDICRDFVYGLYHTISKDQNFLVAHILDQPDYPRAQDVQNALKRKRNPGLIDSEDDEEILHKYEAKGRVAGPQAYIRKILGSEFPQIPMKYIDACLKTSGGTLFSAYRVLEEADRTFDPNKPTYIRIKSRKIATDEFLDDNLDNLIAKSPLEEQEVLRELQVSRRVRWKADEKREEERLHILAEEANCVRAQAEGAMRDCGCCFGDYPLNRMVHCDNDEELHFFCRDCAQRNAETEIGNSRYELKCMDTSGCVAGFSMEQRSLFLDAKTTIALERIHQETELRMAGIENLASCPFCTYAAEYPPVEVNTEFRCQKPDCKKVSCRLCNLESHVPKSCEENAKENGLSVRRQIEEAMSEALIRRCNKCQTPFVKTDGCNKISCTAKGCGNVQCYICSANCTGPNGYSHFNDPHRGGKPTNCPLFDQKGVEVRHSDEVEKAQQKARAKVLAEHPDVTQEDLDIKLSEKVREDEEKRKAAAPHLGFRPLPPFVMAPRPQGNMPQRNLNHRVAPLQDIRPLGIGLWDDVGADPLNLNILAPDVQPARLVPGVNPGTAPGNALVHYGAGAQNPFLPIGFQPPNQRGGFNAARHRGDGMLDFLVPPQQRVQLPNAAVPQWAPPGQEPQLMARYRGRGQHPNPLPGAQRRGRSMVQHDGNRAQSPLAPYPVHVERMAGLLANGTRDQPGTAQTHPGRVRNIPGMNGQDQLHHRIHRMHRVINRAVPQPLHFRPPPLADGENFAGNLVAPQFPAEHEQESKGENLQG